MVHYQSAESTDILILNKQAIRFKDIIKIGIYSGGIDTKKYSVQICVFNDMYSHVSSELMETQEELIPEFNRCVQEWQEWIRKNKK